MPHLFLLVLAALEVSAVSLPLAALTGLGPPWLLMLFAVAMGWLADQAAGRLAPPWQRPLLLLGAVLAALLLPGATFGGPLLVIGVLRPGADGFARAYPLLLLGLYLFWRGSRLATHDSASVTTLFGRGVLASVLSLSLGVLLGSGAPAATSSIQAQIVALGTLGLLALALAHAQEGAGRLGWRWLATLLATIVALVVGAILATGLIGGGTALELAQGLLQLILAPLALIGGLVVWAFVTLLGEPLRALIRALLASLQGFELLPEPPPLAEGDALAVEGALANARQFAEGATLLMALIPLLILVAAILVLRRRAAQATTNEERSSLGLRAGLGSDLRDLLGQLRNPFARRRTGLHAALAAIRGADPNSRVRRAYIGLLLQLEQHERIRHPAQTPAELALTAATLLAPTPVAVLTATYEQARYNPTGTDHTVAERAEAALRDLTTQTQ